MVFGHLITLAFEDNMAASLLCTFSAVQMRRNDTPDTVE